MTRAHGVLLRTANVFFLSHHPCVSEASLENSEPLMRGYQSPEMKGGKVQDKLHPTTHTKSTSSSSLHGMGRNVEGYGT